MRILTIVGKVDTRAIAYPIARALTLRGLTALISDDGAYRRLFHGDGMQGTVSGIDVSVGYKADEDLKNSLNNSGVPYENIVFVSSGYIPKDTTGIIVCHGVDRSMLASDEQEEDEDSKKEEKVVKKSKMSKKNTKDTTGNTENDADTEKNSDDGSKESSGALIGGTPIVEKIEIQKDKIIIPDATPFVEVQISYATAAKKGITSIQLKEQFMNYIYSCEERKEIDIYPDKNYNKILAKILSQTLNIDTNEALSILTRSEYLKGGKVK